MKRLYEVLVPCQTNDGVPANNHDTLVAWIRGLCGGVTVCPRVDGHWVGEGGKLYVEQMLPVRMVTTQEQAVRIATVVRDTFRQECVFLAVIGDVTFV